MPPTTPCSTPNHATNAMYQGTSAAIAFLKCNLCLYDPSCPYPRASQPPQPAISTPIHRSTHPQSTYARLAAANALIRDVIHQRFLCKVWWSKKLCSRVCDQNCNWEVVKYSIVLHIKINAIKTIVYIINMWKWENVKFSLLYLELEYSYKYV